MRSEAAPASEGPIEGVYASDQGTLKLVARDGTVVNGVGTIAHVQGIGVDETDAENGYGIGFNDNGQVAFTAQLTNGKTVVLEMSAADPVTVTAPKISKAASRAAHEITFTSEVTDTFAHAAAVGQSVTFEATALGRTITCAAATDSGGVATCSVAESALTLATLNPSYTVTATPGGYFLGANATGHIT
jgi:hypothetical protein